MLLLFVIMCNCIIIHFLKDFLLNMVKDFNKFKEQQITFEEKFLSTYAAKSNATRGRKRSEIPCKIRTEFQRDRDRILHSKAFRRLKHKTQVFISPLGDHYRTRLTHTLEVSQIARTVARALRLNEDLTEAISLGHDLGHTPFGHTGEAVLNSLLSDGFKHNKQSVRVAEIIEDLNLTEETLDGILNHTGKGHPATLEGQIVKIADRIAYLNHDIDDSIRANILKTSDLPQNPIKILGTTTNERITTMVLDLIENSEDKQEISMSQECSNALIDLRKWMFQNIYTNSIAKTEEHKAQMILTQLYNFYCSNFKLIKDSIHYQDSNTEVIVADYIAGMTDRFAIQKYVENFIPSCWNGEIKQL